MTKLEQKNIKVFYITYTDSKELVGFIDKNKSLLRQNILLFDKLDDEIKSILAQNELEYFVSPNANSLNAKSNKITLESIKEDSLIEQIDEKVINTDIEESKSKVFLRVVRSGESVCSDGDIVVLNRVNSASSIRSSGNVCIYGECHGDIECNGEYMILSTISKGKVIFNGEMITNSMLKYRLNLITTENNELKICDILSF